MLAREFIVYLRASPGRWTGPASFLRDILYRRLLQYIIWLDTFCFHCTAPMTNVRVNSNFTAVPFRHRVFISQIIFVSKHAGFHIMFGHV